MFRHLAPLVTGALIGLAAWLVDSVIYALSMLQTSVWGALFTEVSALRLSVRVLILLIAIFIGAYKTYKSYAEEHEILGLTDDAASIFTDRNYYESLQSKELLPLPTKEIIAEKLNVKKPRARGFFSNLFEQKEHKRNFAKDLATEHSFAAAELARSERLWQYAGNLGDVLNLNFEELSAIRNLCFCYNIGLFGVKQENIDDHAECGAKIVEEFPDFANAANLIRYHHEKWDGSGVYGLAGLEIPLGSRIFAVAWVYDALTKLDGGWRLATEDALEMLYMYSDTALDPELVAAFIGLAGKGKLLVDNTVTQAAFGS